MYVWFMRELKGNYSKQYMWTQINELKFKQNSKFLFSNHVQILIYFKYIKNLCNNIAKVCWKDISGY